MVNESMSGNVIVVGGGQAAASFVARLRAKDDACTITLFTDEPSLPYQRPPLSKKYAVGEMTAEQLELRPLDWYETNRVEVHSSSPVAAIHLDEKTIKLETGETYAWDKLFLSTGSRARPLPTEMGGNLKGIYLLRSLADADALATELKPGRKAVIIGGGYIGLEAASVCRSQGLEVTVVEAAERILQRVACKETSDQFRNLHSKRGVAIREGVGVETLSGRDGQVDGVVLSDGTHLEADFVLVGIGILPNVELAQACGLVVEGGIKVNANCQTSNPNVFAAGDCTVFDFHGHSTRLESVQNAIDQAECAADNIAGETREYAPYPWFWSDQYDVKLQIAGLNRGFDRVVTRPGERDGSLSHFYYKGDQLLAVDAINDPRTYMVCKRLLEAGKNLPADKASDQEFQLKSLL